MRFFSILLWGHLLWGGTVPPTIEKSPALSAEEVLSWVDPTHAGSVNSVEKLLEKLPEAYRTYFVLQYESHSNHQSDPGHPRIIFFGPDAKLLMGVSGLSTDPFYHTIEMIEYEPDGAAFSFYSIHFNVPGTPTIEKNPSDCLRCHGQDPKPNWEPYSLWPGTYGSLHDRIIGGTLEHNSFQQFLASYPSSPRYKHLVGPFHVQSNEGINSNNFYLTNGGVGPSSSLSILLGFLNRDRIAKKLISSPQHSLYRAAFTAALIGCPQPIDQFLPAGVRDNHPSNYSDVFHETKAMMVKDFSRKLRTLMRHLDVDKTEIMKHADLFGFRGDEVERIAKLRFLLTKRKHPIDFDRWALSISRSSLDFNDGVSGLQNLVGHYLPVAYSAEEPLYRLMPIKTVSFSLPSINIDTFSLSSEIEPACDFLQKEAQILSTRE